MEQLLIRICTELFKFIIAALPHLKKMKQNKNKKPFWNNFTKFVLKLAKLALGKIYILIAAGNCLVLELK